MKNRIWTEDRKKELKSYCEIGTGMGFKTSEIAKRMNLTQKQIKDAMSRFKVKNGRAGFQKGKSPWNKGKRWKKGTYENKPTDFQPGHKPHHAVNDGEISVSKCKGRIYHRIKINGKWESYPRYVWKKIVGEIPPKHVVRVKDYTKDIDINNLECISMRDNAKRNTNPSKSALTQKKKRATKTNDFYNPQEISWEFYEHTTTRQVKKFKVVY